MSEPLRVLLVTSWDEACGIAEHSAMLKEAVEAADPGIEILPDAFALDPVRLHDAGPFDVLHLNYQAALHSRWTPELIRELRGAGYKVLVTYHDTGVPNSDQCKRIIDAADAAVVHEPFDDLPEGKTHYWRMGVPRWHPGLPPRHYCGDERPMLGSIGFPFPWKCYDKLVEVATAAGWAVLLLAPGATAEQVASWERHGGALTVYTDFTPRAEAVAMLAGCDATAFPYVTHNTGQSGALLLGIAARKPVVALSTCRQFRALYDDPLGREAIVWCRTFEEIAETLPTLPIQRVDPQTVALAEQESWAKLGQKYAALYRSLV